ncbi:hypothetical protein L580_0841 [Serratia fonticola AU-P3(3)]|nr:hypothetical protein L580_0841 [Serratia fonticola AU-P3(3)]
MIATWNSAREKTSKNLLAIMSIRLYQGQTPLLRAVCCP